jgi:hypothetical protein
MDVAMELFGASAALLLRLFACTSNRSYAPFDARRASHAQVSAADLQRVAKKMLKSPVSVRQSNQACRQNRFQSGRNGIEYHQRESH